ncbi:MAG: divergent polysaccharide deacetylase family protein [Hyphomicrobiales bacterium]
MSMSDATSLPSLDSSSPTVSESLSRSYAPFVIAASVLCLMTIGAIGLAWHGGWFRAPPLPNVIVPIEWPQEIVVTGTSRRTVSQHGLAPAPDPRLIEIIPEGVLPIRAEDGATPLKVYARPLPPQAEPATTEPRVAIILRGAGIGQLATLEAILRLPSDMSFALSPYAREIDRQSGEIREEGHEVFLDVPLISREQVFEDSGPKALMPAAGDAENLTRLKWSMARVAGYAGLLAISGSDGLITPDVKDLLARQAETRGLGLVTHSRPDKTTSAPQNNHARITSLIHRDLPPNGIDEALERLTAEAKKNGSALGVAVITPLAIERLKKWSEGLAAQGVRLVPASSVLLQQR